MSAVIFAEWLSAPEADTKYRIELHQQGFGGSVREVQAVGSRSDHNYQSLDAKEPHKTPLLKSELSFTWMIRDEADHALMTNVFSSDPGEWKLVKKVNDAQVWEGFVDVDKVNMKRSPFPFHATVTARSEDHLSGEDFTLTSGRKKIIEVIAGLLPYGLDIYTYTSWKEGSLTTEDFLNERYIDEFAIRNYARSSGESDTTIDKLEALNKILRAFGLILFQDNGWRIYQLTALENADNIRQYRYNSSGVLQANSLVDITTDLTGSYLLRTSERRAAKAYKSVSVRYDHRTTIQNIKFDSVVTFTGTGSESENQFFISSGDQRLRFEGNVEAFAQDPEPPSTDVATECTAEITIEFDADTHYWWNGTTWATSFASVFVSMNNPATNRWVADFDILTDLVPEESGTITITIRNAETDQDPTGAFNIPTTTTYRDAELFIVNPSVEEGASTAIDYRLTQAKNRSGRYDHGSIWFSDGPASYSRGAVSRDVSGETLTSSWSFGSGSLTHPRILLDEVLNIQRGDVRSLDVDLFGDFSPLHVVSVDSAFYFFIGGSQNGKSNKWRATLLRINPQTSETDVFEENFITSGGEGSTGASTGTGGGGLSQDVADARYFRQSQNLDEGTPSTMRGNMGLADGSAALNLASVNIDGNAFVDGSRNVTMSGKFLSASDYSFRNAGDTNYRKISILQATDVNHAVAAGRTITLNADSDSVITWNNGAQNLTSDRAWTPTIADHGDGQRGVLSPSQQIIYGGKLFNADIGSPDFVTRLTDWRLTKEGALDARSGFFDELATRSFISDTTLSLAGTDFLSKSNATLLEDVTFDQIDTYLFESGDERLFENGDVYDFENAVYDILVEEHAGLPGFNVFDNEDYIVFRVKDSYDGDGKRFLNVWGRALWPDVNDSDSPDNEDGTQSYRFSAVGDSQDPPLIARTGMVVLDYGKDGDGIIERTALLDDSPYDRIFTWSHRPWRTDLYQVRSQVGILDGITDTDFSVPVEGAGIYTDNGFFKGRIVVTGGTGATNFDDLPDGAATGEDIATSLGYDSFEALKADTLNDTLIQGGFIRTGVLDVDAILAVNATITATLTLQGQLVAGNLTLNSSGLSHPQFSISGGNATFSGALSAATGTFAGELSSATGTFSGSVSLGGGDLTIDGDGITMTPTGSPTDISTISWESGSDIAYIRGVLPSSGTTRLDHFASQHQFATPDGEGFSLQSLGSPSENRFSIDVPQLLINPVPLPTTRGGALGTGHVYLNYVSAGGADYYELRVRAS